jgi:hypothetical protein
LIAQDAANNASLPNNVTVATAPAPGAGLAATYFDNMDFAGASFTRTDADINFNWGSASPMSGIAADTFSVRWSGFITAPASGSFTFHTTTDDGVRLWVNNRLIVDKFVPQAATEWSGSISLAAGQRVPIRIEYFDRFGGAVAKLSWSSATMAKQIVPKSAFSMG